MTGVFDRRRYQRCVSFTAVVGGVRCQENQSRTFFHPSSAASVRYLVLSTEKKAWPALS